MQNRCSKGSSPIKGNISDNKLSMLTNIPKSTLTDWKKSINYRRELYWLLKAMTEKEIQDFLLKSKMFYR